MEATFTVVGLIGASAYASSALERVRAAAEASCAAGDQIGKTMSDAIVLLSREPVAALELAGRVHARLTAEPDLPFRIAVHHGEVVRRGGEWFGSTINIAVRILGEARRGQIIATEIIARQANEAGYLASEIGSVELPSVLSPVQLFALDLQAAEITLPCDPVCGMAVDPDSAAGMLRHDGVEHWFCSLACAAAFAADPERYRAR
ncbi:MAG TPA: YHS domain-containing protein [Candidatus Binatia bacterium]|nr:YHS domain-containing protein [Candidatus Binatia bacterium]